MSIYENTTEIETFSHCETSLPIHSSRLSHRENYKPKREIQLFTPLTYNVNRANSIQNYSTAILNNQIVTNHKTKPFSSKLMSKKFEYILCTNLSDISDLDLDV